MLLPRKFIKIGVNLALSQIFRPPLDRVVRLLGSDVKRTPIVDLQLATREFAE